VTPQTLLASTKFEGTGTSRGKGILENKKGTQSRGLNRRILGGWGKEESRRSEGGKPGKTKRIPQGGKFDELGNKAQK